MMIPKSTRMSIASGSAFIRSFQPNLGPAGPQSGCMRQIQTTVPRMATVRMALGMMLPKNSLPMD